MAITDTEPAALSKLMPPARAGQYVYILVSDSGLCMITGSKNKPTKHTMNRVFEEQAGPNSSCAEFIHDMKWGATLKVLVKRAMWHIQDARERHPEKQIIIAVYWNGNELVGKGGIEKSNVYPFEWGETDPNEIHRDCMRHTETLVRTCREYEVSAVAMLGIQTGLPYQLGRNFTQFTVQYHYECRRTFTADYFARSDAEPAFYIIDVLDMVVWWISWSCEITTTCSCRMRTSRRYTMSVFYQLAMAGRKDLTKEWRYALKKLAKDNRRDIREMTINPRRNIDLHLNIYDSLKAKIIAASRPSISQQPAPVEFTRSEAWMEQPDYEAPFVLPEKQITGRPQGQVTGERAM